MASWKPFYSQSPPPPKKNPYFLPPLLSPLISRIRCAAWLAESKDTSTRSVFRFSYKGILPNLLAMASTVRMPASTSFCSRYWSASLLHTREIMWASHPERFNPDNISSIIFYSCITQQKPHFHMPLAPLYNIILPEGRGFPKNLPAKSASPARCF